MKRCPFCAEEIQADAVVCKHCGRDLRGPSKRSGTAGCFVAAIVTAGVSVLGVAGWVVLATVTGGTATTVTDTPATPAAATTVDMRRLVLENRWPDDSARNHLFRSALGKSGNRCDKVNKAIMKTRGSWIIECAPGYKYGVLFNEDGKPIAFAPL